MICAFYPSAFRPRGARLVFIRKLTLCTCFYASKRETRGLKVSIKPQFVDGRLRALHRVVLVAAAAGSECRRASLVRASELLKAQSGRFLLGVLLELETVVVVVVAEEVFLALTRRWSAPSVMILPSCAHSFRRSVLASALRPASSAPFSCPGSRACPSLACWLWPCPLQLVGAQTDRFSHVDIAASADAVGQMLGTSLDLALSLLFAHPLSRDI